MSSLSGAAYNDSATDCLTDMDGDGYSPLVIGDCFVLDMQDSWGDGWDWCITIYADGVMVDSGLPGSTNSQLQAPSIFRVERLVRSLSV